MRLNKLLLMALLLLSGIADLYATHIVGGGITYEYLGDVPGTDLKRYRFTMKLYRDCLNGQAQFDSPAYINTYRGTYQNSWALAPTDVWPANIQQVSIQQPGCITDLPGVCLQEATYIWERSLPVTTQESFFVAYQRCCRTSAIANVINPSNTGATYFVEITPAALQMNNSSPVFNNFPPPIICNGYPIEVDYAVTDKDGDQLVYSLCPSYSGGGLIGFDCEAPKPKTACPPPFDQLHYTQPTYSALDPMGGNPKVTIDPQSGFISGTPTHNGQYVVNVCVQEYREGTLLSVSRREFQFNVAPCAPQVSARIEYDSLAGPGHYVVRSCTGSKTLTLKNTSFSLPNIENYHWSFDLKDGTTLENSQDFDLTATFPDYGSYTGMLVLNAGLVCSDTAFIRVDIFPESTLSLGSDQALCPGQVVTLGAPSGSGLHTFEWQNGSSSSTLQAIQPGTYWLEAQNRCGTLLRDTVLLTARPDCPCPEGAFFKTLGTEAGREVGSVLCATRDSHLYLAGLKDERAFLAKLTLEGQLLWARDLSTDVGSAIFVTQLIEDSEGMVVGLGTQGIAPDPTNGAIFRYDPTNNQMLWAKRLDATNAQTTSLIEAAAGGNYLLNQNPESDSDRVTEILEISRATGDVLPARSRRYAFQSGFFANTMLRHQDALYLHGWAHLQHVHQPPFFSHVRSFIMRVDAASLTPDWASASHTAIDTTPNLTHSSLEGLDMIIDHDSLVSVYAGNESGSITFRLYLQKTTTQGEVVWVKRYDLDDALPEELVAVPDGYLILAHNYLDTRYLIKTDKNGQLLFVKKLEVNTALFPLLIGTLSSHQDQLLTLGDWVYLTSFDNFDIGDALLLKMDHDAAVKDSCGFYAPLEVSSVEIEKSDIVRYPIQPAVSQSPTADSSLTVAVSAFDLPARLVCACSESPTCSQSLDLGPDLVLCADTTMVLDAGPGFATYLWQDGSTGRTLTTSGFDVFHVAATDSCGTVFRDTILITRSLVGDTKLADTSLCPGQSLSVQVPGFSTYQWSPAGGLSCTDCSTVLVQPGSTTRYALFASNADGCWVRDSFTVTVLPNPTRTQVIAFYPNQPVILGGQSYSQAATITLNVPAATGGCDSIITYILEVRPTQIDVQCPANQSTTLPIGASTIAVNYAAPAAATDCPNGAVLKLLSGLASGSNFPAGVNTVCYEAANGCGDRDSCCFTITVNNPAGACDSKTIGCIRYDMLDIRFNAAGERRYRIRVSNNCASAISYVAFQLPTATAAASPAEGATYTAPATSNTYAVRNPNASPFHSIRFKAILGDLLNGESDVFEYALPPQSTPQYIQAVARLRDQTSYAAHLNTFFCPVQPWGGESSAPSAAKWPGAAPLLLYPNPSTGTLTLQWAGSADLPGMVQVFNAQGQLVFAQTFDVGQEAFTLQLPDALTNGLYYLSLRTEGGSSETARFVITR